MRDTKARFRYIVLVLATLSFLTNGLSLFGYPPVSGLIIQDLNMSYTQSGLLMSSFALSYLIMQVPAGILLDRLRADKLLVGFQALMGVAALLFALSGFWAEAFLLRILGGLGGGVAFLACVKLLSQWFPPKELNRALGIYGAGWGLSQTLSFTLLPTLAEVGGWRLASTFTGALTFGTAILIFILIRIEPPYYIPREVGLSERLRLKGLISKRLIHLTLVNLTGIAVLTGVITWAPLQLELKFGSTTIEAGFILAAIGFFNIAGSFLGGIAAKRWSGGPVIFSSMVFCIIAPIFLAFASSPHLALAAISLTGWASMFYFGPLFALVPLASRSPKETGLTFGVFNSFSNLGTFLSPVILGLILDFTGSYTLAFTSLGAIALLGLYGAYGIAKPEFKSPHVT